jgi:hypothetical protein
VAAAINRTGLTSEEHWTQSAGSTNAAEDNDHLLVAAVAKALYLGTSATGQRRMPVGRGDCDNR